MSLVTPDGYHGRVRRPLVIALVSALGVLAALAATATSATARGGRPRATALRPTLPAAPIGIIHDRVLRGRGGPAAHLASLGSGGVYYTPKQHQPVHIYTSRAYRPDPSVNQSYADFLGGLIHGHEITKLRVYIATPAEVAVLCRPDALACYLVGRDEMVTLGQAPADGTPLEDVVAHEYGHHIAEHRRNPPWKAIDWGTKYWATHENVCRLKREHKAFPGAERSRARYERNPGEAFADSYRIVNGGSPDLFQFARRFFPDQAAKKDIVADVTNPWRSYVHHRRSGRLNGRRRHRTYRFATPLDGTFVAKARGRGHLRVRVNILHGHYRLAHGRSRARAVVCGHKHLRVRVGRRGGYGRFRLRVKRP